MKLEIGDTVIINPNSEYVMQGRWNNVAMKGVIINKIKHFDDYCYKDGEWVECKMD